MNTHDVETKVWAVTGNDLLSGRVVYLSTTGGFVNNLTAARLFSEQPAAEACLQLALAFSQDVNDLHLMALIKSSDALMAETMRERVRHYGPGQLV